MALPRTFHFTEEAKTRETLTHLLTCFCNNTIGAHKLFSMVSASCVFRQCFLGCDALYQLRRAPRLRAACPEALLFI